MTAANISRVDRKNSYYCIYCLDILSGYQGETKLIAFSGGAKRKKLKIR